MKRLLTIVWISTAVALLPACQGLNLTPASRAKASLASARDAWHVLERETSGSKPAQQAQRKYNQSVSHLVKTLQGTEGTAAWGKTMQWDGVNPWHLVLDAPTRNGTAKTLALSEFSRCEPATEVKLNGFSRVVAHGGLGIPVVLSQQDPLRVSRPFHPVKGEFLPATAVLEFPAVAVGQASEARLRFYNPLMVSEVKTGGRSLPLAENLTAALQGPLTDAIDDKNGQQKLTPSASGEDESQLFFLSRYDRSKVPVVFVHGMRSGPSVWKNTVNELFADPELRRRYQPVCFIYPSGLPIPASAARLRELLTRSRAAFDPGHHDAGFGRMVLVGHSMGGLLARMQVIDSKKDFWSAFFTVPPRELAGDIDVKTQRMLQQSLFFEHRDDVKTTVFISTPHQGSELADNTFLRSLVRLILFLPKTARQRLQAITALPAAVIQPTLRSFGDWGMEGTENLTTKHPYFRALARQPLTVPFHSVIASRNAADFRHGSDGIVPYWSSHLEGAVSETIVPYPHASLEEPKTVQAVMTILKDKS